MSNNTSSDPFLQSPVTLRPDDNLIFVVYKQGRFGHGLHGAHVDKANAINMAKLSAARDRDDHHSYDVYPLPLGRLPDNIEDFMADYGWMNMEPVFSVRKKELHPDTHSNTILLDNNNAALCYVVYKRGRFGHGIHGASLNKRGAINMAKEAAKRDGDSHHSYDVYPLSVGTLPKNLPDVGENYKYDYGWMNEKPVFSIKKDGVD
jgi:hypothetical protein